MLPCWSQGGKVTMVMPPVGVAKAKRAWPCVLSQVDDVTGLWVNDRVKEWTASWTHTFPTSVNTLCICSSATGSYAHTHTHTRYSHYILTSKSKVLYNFTNKKFLYVFLAWLDHKHYLFCLLLSPWLHLHSSQTLKNKIIYTSKGVCEREKSDTHAAVHACGVGQHHPVHRLVGDDEDCDIVECLVDVNASGKHGAVQDLKT